MKFQLAKSGLVWARRFTFLYVLFTTCGFSQAQDTLFFKDRIQNPSVENVFKTKGYYNWGGSIIKGDEGMYHLFYSRWSKEYTFLGWLTHSEIAHATSQSPSGPWTFKETVLKGRRSSDHWDQVNAHNPKIKYFEGKYYLYYISTNAGLEKLSEEELIETSRNGYQDPKWKVLRNNQRTGVAVSSSLNGPWSRSVKPILEPTGPITTIAVNPAVTRGADGQYYLIIKGDKPKTKDFIRNQAIAIADSPIGPFFISEHPVIDYMDTEDMSLWYDRKRDNYYGVFHAHDFIGMVSSKDGQKWNKATEYVLHRKTLSLAGKSIEPNRMERPFVYIEEHEPRVLSVAVKRGDESYLVFMPIEPQVYPKPNKRQLAWQEAELGAVFHYDLHVFDGEKYSQGNNRISPVADYQIFKPDSLNTDQWIKSIKDAGFTFAIFTATHETGFAMYQSEVNPYSMRSLNFQDGKGDLVRDFVNSCRKYGIKAGIYIGIRWNSFLGIHNFKVNGSGDFAKNRQEWYKNMVEGMVKELCTNYGELFEIWFDGGADSPFNGAPDVLPIVQRYQPNCLFYHNIQLAEARWGGSESGTVSYPCWATFPYYSTGTGKSAHEAIAADNYKLLKEGAKNGAYWMPAMADAPLRGYNGRHEWFWEPGDEAHIYPLKNLMNIYYKSVGRNATLIMGLTPNPHGLLPEPDVQRLKKWGNEIERRFSKPLARTSGEGMEYSISFDKETLTNHVILQEDIRHGESVRAYEIQGYIDRRWQSVAKGESIGHKRIQKFKEVKAKRYKLVIKKSERAVTISNFSVYYINTND